MDYFESYEDLSVHCTMLEDLPRISAYRQAILDNRSAFEGKTVLDVGAGTGILSVFCAQAGASKVYAVEANEIYKIAKEIVKENNVDTIVEVIHSKVELLNIPDGAKVDIIVSEWMGHYLLHEGMLDSVIFARDNFLRPGGLLFPENVILYSAPCSVPSLNQSWDDVCGVSMKSFGRSLKKKALLEPQVMDVKPEDILSEPECILWLDLNDVTLQDIESIKYRQVSVAIKRSRYQGICLWFTCTFPSHSTEPVVLATGPEDPKTHWKQTVISLPTDMEVEEGTPIAFDLLLERSPESSRRYAIEVTMLDPDEIPHPEHCGCHLTKCILMKAVRESYERGDPPNS